MWLDGPQRECKMPGVNATRYTTAQQLLGIEETIGRVGMEWCCSLTSTTTYLPQYLLAKRPAPPPYTLLPAQHLQNMAGFDAAFSR